VSTVLRSTASSLVPLRFWLSFRGLVRPPVQPFIYLRSPSAWPDQRPVSAAHGRYEKPAGTGGRRARSRARRHLQARALQAERRGSIASWSSRRFPVTTPRWSRHRAIPAREHDVWVTDWVMPDGAAQRGLSISTTTSTTCASGSACCRRSCISSRVQPTCGACRRVADGASREPQPLTMIMMGGRSTRRSPTR